MRNGIGQQPVRATARALLAAAASCGGAACGGESEPDATDSASATDTTNAASTTSGNTSSTTGGSGGSSSSGASSGSGSTASGSGGVSAASSTGPGGAGGTSGAAGGTSGESLCPLSVPANGSACNEAWIDETSFPSAHCAWGADPRPLCRVRGVCSEGQWQILEPDPTSCDEPPLGSACPDSPAPDGSACDSANLECWYASGTRCTCSPCMGGSEWPLCGEIEPPEWACTSPDPACPNPLPNAGDVCDEEQSCGLDCELPIDCRAGVWQWGQNACPICAAPDTPVATPDGDRPIASLRAGDLVFSVSDDAIVVVPVLQVGSTPVFAHQVLRVTLSNGGVLQISPGHPTADGRTFAELASGSTLDELHSVVSAELVQYHHARTHDILPASPSGSYFAAGALIGSTLARR